MLVLAGEGLQSGDIGGKDEFTVADGERGERIQLCQYRDMAVDHDLAVDAFRVAVISYSLTCREKQD